MPSDSEYLSVRETARRLSVHENTVRNWAKQGKLRPIRLPGSGYQRFSADEVDRLAGAGGSVKVPARSNVAVAQQLVDADFLARWSGSVAERLLPRVIGRLLEARPEVERWVMPGGDGVSSRGWDGQVDGAGGSSWVPKGFSCWEISTSSEPRKKAQDDYRKRSRSPLGVDPANATFVFVTSRRWNTAREWEAKRRVEGKWADVRVITADELGPWLEATPSVQIWLSEEVGLKPFDVGSAETWWSRFAEQTRPPLPQAFVLAGRTDALDPIVRDLETSEVPGVVTLRAGSRQEALAVTVASLPPLLLERTLVVRSRDAWDRLILQPESVNLIVDTDDDVDVRRAVANGHNVLVPVGPDDLAGGDTRRLPALDRQDAAEALADRGVDFVIADRLAGLAHRSLAAFLRDDQIAVGSRARPPWLSGGSASMLAQLCLLGSWAQADSDWSLVSQTAGTSQAEIETELRRWSDSADPPFIDVGRLWRVVSLEGQWQVLNSSLSASALSRFAAAALQVLTERDELLDLDLTARFAAQAQGQRRQYSSSLRAGVADGLAFLASTDSSQMRSAAEHVVRQLLSKANDDPTGLLWASLSDVLPRLAEAAPDEFLRAVEVGSASTDPVLKTIFRDGEESNQLFDSSPHTGLLWALETLAWSETYLTPATLCLGRLDELDEPRGKLANRPGRTLKTIYLHWLPQTDASLEARLEAIDALRQRHPNSGWDLELALLPRAHDSSMYTSRPRFRTWATDAKRGATATQMVEATRAIVDRLLADVGSDPKRLVELIEHFGPLPNETAESVVEFLESSVPELGESARLGVWQTLRETVTRHQSHSEARWALPAELVVRLDALAVAVEPADPVHRNAHLFSWHPEVPGLDVDDYEGWQGKLRGLRADAVGEILTERQLDGVFALSETCQLPHLVGIALFDVAKGDFESDALSALIRGGGGSQLARSYLRALADQRGSSWITGLGSIVAGWPSSHQAALLLALPGFDPATRTLADALPPEARREYWSRVEIFDLGALDLEQSVQELLEHERPAAAVDLLAVHCGEHAQSREQPDPKLVVTALDQMLGGSDDPQSSRGSLAYEVGSLLDYLVSADADEDVLSRLEWSFFSLLENHRTPTHLYHALCSTPALFVQLVSSIYRGKGEQPRDPSEDEKLFAHQAWLVLHHWRTPPGLRDDGTIEASTLRAWVRAARTELIDRDRGDIGDQQIGELLSGTPPGPDGVWPLEPIRELIEDLASEHLEEGLRVGRFNGRGITGRGIYDGGAQERAIAAEYRVWAKQCSSWVRTARLLNKAADIYERDAEDEDERALRDASSP